MQDLIHRRNPPGRKERGKSVEFPAGATIFDRQRPCRRVYLLHSGQVRLMGDRGAIVAYLRKGDLFGEKTLLAPEAGTLIAKSLSNVHASAFRRSELLDYLQQDRAFASALIRNLARRLANYEQVIQNAIVERAERRLALVLRTFVPGRPASGWVRLSFSPSNSELARTIGSTRWRVAHFMHNFQQLGWLQRRPELWVLRDRLDEFLGQTAQR
ncbi:MAG TPA: Crp/Fnr family transcriptional regulator [Candidatus Acidoferrales bacterium]|nr:Crp/Fnr family transcriptional regulator [Candidatus Acidoferrales bacterium]